MKRILTAGNGLRLALVAFAHRVGALMSGTINRVQLVDVGNGLRLALFALAYGSVGVMMSGTINRVLLVEVGLSKALVGVMFALPYLESPVRLWLGYRSDGYPIWGKRREPYIIGGAILGGLGVVLVTLLTVRAAPGAWLILSGITLSLLLYGFGRSMAHNSFQALLTDKYAPGTRRVVATLIEVATLMGSVMAGGLIGRELRAYSPEKLVSVSLVVMGIFIVLSLLAAPGQEPRNPLLPTQAAHAKRASFWRTLNDVVLADPQVRIFFTLILCAFVGTLAQDIWLEGYGGEVLKMGVGETTALTQYWGVGVLFSMLLSGLVLLPLIGYVRVMRIGFAASALVFLAVIVVGGMGRADLFRWVVLVMGVGTGLAGAGMLSGVVTFSSPVRAGLLMGVWGMANALGRALGTFMGGALAEIVQRLTGSPYYAYSAIFALEVVMLTVALLFSFKLDLASSIARAEATA